MPLKTRVLVVDDSAFARSIIAKKLACDDLEIIDFVELQAPEAAETRYDFVDAEWAHRWPSEQVWRVKKRA